MRPRIADAADKLCGKSDVYLASTFSSINNSELRESLTLSFSPCLSFSLFYYVRRPTDESSGLTRARFFPYQTGVHYSRVCETRPGFTILYLWLVVSRLVHVRSIDRSIPVSGTIVFRGMTICRDAMPRWHVCVLDHCTRAYNLLFIFHALFFFSYPCSLSLFLFLVVGERME